MSHTCLPQLLSQVKFKKDTPLTQRLKKVLW